MLEGLDQVDWVNLVRKDVPVWIRGLASPDENVRKAAYDNLYDCHLFDGTIHYTGTPYLVPFLIELLSYEDVQEKDSILLMLMQLADAVLSAKRQNANHNLANPLYDSILKGRERYRSYLESHYKITREAAQSLLGYLEKISQMSDE